MGFENRHKCRFAFGSGIRHLILIGSVTWVRKRSDQIGAGEIQAIY